MLSGRESQFQGDIAHRPSLSAHHVEGLLVAYDTCLGIVLLDEWQGAAMVGFDVVDDDVVDRAVADYRAYVGEKLREEVYLNGIDERNLLVVGSVKPVGIQPVAGDAWPCMTLSTMD